MKTPTAQSRILGITAGFAALAVVLAGCSSSSSGKGGGDTGGSTGGATGGKSAGASTGFKVNLDDCEDADSATKKVTDTWKIGYSAPLSGPVAGVVTYALDGYKARIAAQNAAGGINGVKIKVDYKDDAFTPDRAKANATEFLQSDHVDSLITFGEGQVGAIADDQNAACVPLLYPSASILQTHDVSQYPWTVAFLPSTDAEARYDVALIKQKFPQGVKVGIAENQTASGKAESGSFQKIAKGTNVKVSVVASSTDPNAAATRLKAAGVDVVYIAGITNDCGPDVQAMARIGFRPKLVINPSNCADGTGYIQAGEAADGGVVPSWLKNPADPSLAKDPGVKEYLSQVTTADKNNTITVAGWVEADLTINTLKQAAASPEGLSHVGAIKAARDQAYPCPMLINGVKWLSAPDNLTGFDSFQTLVWNAAAKTFKPEGNLISIAAK